VKRFVAATQKKDLAEAESSLKDMIKKLDTAAGKGVVTKNSASRKKSRMQKLFNSLTAAR
jgi:small subunit ribosomal protein S20